MPWTEWETAKAFSFFLRLIAAPRSLTCGQFTVSYFIPHTYLVLVLGIETSCDETAAAVVRDGNVIVSSVIASQIEMHRPFGGVVPELASREHLAKIEPIVDEAIAEANISLGDIDAIAVTQGPGLVGSLLVGVCYAKALAYALEIPLVAVNHIEGHVYSVIFENPAIEYPALALIVSGGHTNLFFVPEPGQYKVVSRTRDDAAGEAFDKVAKMLGLEYPGGPVIERVARDGDPSSIKFTRPKISDGRPDFSFSGLKTAVAKYLREHRVDPVREGAKASAAISDLAASFQASVVGALIDTTKKQAALLGARTLIVAGGVASNASLREAAQTAARRLGIPVYFPSRHLSTDNAAMIAAAGFFHLKRGERSGMDVTADVTLRLQNLDSPDDELRRKKVKYRL
jgi:N6-L-threonylcarbamoyladenine synthase